MYECLYESMCMCVMVKLRIFRISVYKSVYIYTATMTSEYICHISSAISLVYILIVYIHSYPRVIHYS